MRLDRREKNLFSCLCGKDLRSREMAAAAVWATLMLTQQASGYVLSEVATGRDLARDNGIRIILQPVGLRDCLRLCTKN